MYINQKHEAGLIASVNERVLNEYLKKSSLNGLSSRASYTPFNKKSWPEVIRLYKESKKEKALLS